MVDTDKQRRLERERGHVIYLAHDEEDMERRRRLAAVELAMQHDAEQAAQARSALALVGLVISHVAAVALGVWIAGGF